MALQQQGLVVSAVSATTLSITAETNQSFLVRRVMVEGASTSPTYATIKTKTTTVGYFRCDEGKWNNLASSSPGKYNGNVLDMLMDRKVFKGYPVASGETFSITLNNQAANIVVEYDLYASGDQKSTDQDGSAAKVNTMVLYGTNSTALSATGYAKIDDTLMPSGFTTFPYESTFDSSAKGSLIGVMAQDVQYNNYAGSVDHYATTEYLRTSLNNEVLFSLDEVGFPMIGSGAASGSANASYGAGFNTVPWARDDEPADVHFFATPIPLVSGDRLTTEVDVKMGDASATLPASELNVAYLIQVTRA